MAAIYDSARWESGSSVSRASNLSVFVHINYIKAVKLRENEGMCRCNIYCKKIDMYTIHAD